MMDSIYRIVNTLKNEEDKKKKGLYTLQFVDYIETEEGGEPLEVVRNSIDLVVGQILRDALNMAEGLDSASFAITDDSPADRVRYIEFIKEINAGIPKEGLLYCYTLYDDFYTLGKSRDAYVPTMNVKMELDCSDEGYLEEYFYIETFEDMLVYDFYSAIKSRMAVKKCQLCGTYFITRNRTDELYCSPECRSVVSRQRSKIHHRLDDENELLKRRIASRLQQRTKVVNEALREERTQIHQQFLYEVKQWKKKVKSGAATAENYKLWLQSQDIKYATMLERKEPLPAEARPTRVIKYSQVAGSEAGREGAAEDELAKRLAALASPEEPAAEPDVPLEEQGVRPDIKARIMNHGGKRSENVRSAIFPSMDSYDDLEKQIEENDAADMDFGAFIKNTFGKSMAESAAAIDANAVSEAETSRAEEDSDSADSGKIVANMRPTNIRQSSFPTFESVLAAVEKEETVQGPESSSDEPSAEAPVRTISVDDMKSRLNGQIKALRERGLDDLAGLLDDEEDEK